MRFFLAICSFFFYGLSFAQVHTWIKGDDPKSVGKGWISGEAVEWFSLFRGDNNIVCAVLASEEEVSINTTIQYDNGEILIISHRFDRQGTMGGVSGGFFVNRIFLSETPGYNFVRKLVPISQTFTPVNPSADHECWRALDFLPADSKIKNWPRLLLPWGRERLETVETRG